MNRILLQLHMRWVLGGLAFAGIVVGAAAAFAVGPGSEGPSEPNLDVKQAAAADDGGLHFQLSRAAFSGTATFIEIAVGVSGNASDVVRARIRSESLESDSLRFAPGSDGWNASPSAPAIARLSPVALNGPPKFSFNAVDVMRSDGSNATIVGHWQLAVSLPSDVASRLKTETLVGPAASDQGTTVSVQGAVRSTTETLVTVSLESPEAISQLGQPIMVVDGKQLFGGVIATQENGTLLTYAFAPTPFGSAATVRFGPFVKAGASQAGAVTVDLGSVIARNSLQGKDRETATILPADTVSEPSGIQNPTSLRFSTIFNATEFPDQHWTVTITIPGALRGQGTSSFSAVGARGQKLDIVGLLIGYSKDPAGVISSPRTEVDLLINSLDDIRGPVTITFDGQPDDTLRGNWTVTLTPGP